MATNWEERYQCKDTPWDKGGPHPELLSFLKSAPMHGTVFVPGAGPGYDVRAIAATADEVVGLDVSATAVTMAKKIPTVGGERYVQGDLFALPKKLQAAFDWVWEHTCFCAIDPERRADYAAAIASALKPDGFFLACFYLDPGLDPGETGPPFGTSREELDTLFSPHFQLVKEWVPQATYPGREGRELMRLMSRRVISVQ